MVQETLTIPHRPVHGVSADVEVTPEVQAAGLHGADKLRGPGAGALCGGRVHGHGVAGGVEVDSGGPGVEGYGFAATDAAGVIAAVEGVYLGVQSSGLQGGEGRGEQ